LPEPGGPTVFSPCFKIVRIALWTSLTSLLGLAVSA
jgi:hypothetical protein